MSWPIEHRRDRPHYVYRCYDGDDRLLYVGLSASPFARITGHRANAWWWTEVARVRYTVFPDRDKGLLMERKAIAEEMPRCNVKGRWFHWWPETRTHWTAQDYSEYHVAVTRSANGMTGTPSTARLLARIAEECHGRFGVDIRQQAVSA